MSTYDLCDACIEKHGPFEKPERGSLLKGFCHGCQTTASTTTVIGNRVMCTNMRRCGGWTPVFPPEKYDQYTAGWTQLRHGGDFDEYLPPIYTHCPACARKELSQSLPGAT